MTTLPTIGQAVADRLTVAERALDAAIVEASALNALMPRARLDAAIPAQAAQETFEHAAAALALLTEARTQLSRTHAAVAAVARDLGLDALAAGPVDKPEDDPPHARPRRTGVGREGKEKFTITAI